MIFVLADVFVLAFVLVLARVLALGALDEGPPRHDPEYTTQAAQAQGIHQGARTRAYTKEASMGEVKKTTLEQESSNQSGTNTGLLGLIWGTIAPTRFQSSPSSFENF